MIFFEKINFPEKNVGKQSDEFQIWKGYKVCWRKCVFRKKTLHFFEKLEYGIYASSAGRVVQFKMDPIIKTEVEQSIKKSPN